MLLKYFRLFSLSLLLGVLFSGCDKTNNDNKQNSRLSEEIKNARISVFSGFYFIGKYSGIPSIYRYDYQNNKVKIFWSHNDERVIDLLTSPENTSAFFITRKKQRLKSSKPAIESGRLYRIDFETNKVELITQLEEGIQIIPFWNDNDSFTLVINSVDKNIASYINKNTQVYNPFGKLLSDNTETFDITRDGYPVINPPTIKYFSPNELFKVTSRNDSIFVTGLISNQSTDIGQYQKELIKIGWADDNKHLILHLKSKPPSEKNVPQYASYKLVVFDLQLRKTVKIIEESETKRFVLIGDFLIFDSGIGDASGIEVLELSSLEKKISIKLPGGCSIRSLSR